MGMHISAANCKYTAFLRKSKWEIKTLGFIKMTDGYIIQDSLLSQNQKHY